MKFVILMLFSLSAFAQTAATDNNCSGIQGNNNLTQDFGGLCKYEAANATLAPATSNRVIYFGDSITEMWRDGIVGLDPKDTLNRGYSGQTTSQMLVRFRADVINLKPRIVHFMAGTNDLAGNTGPITFEKIKNNIRSITEFAQMHGIQVVIGSILPAKVFSWRPGMKPAQDIQKMNQWLKTYADNSGFIYVDYYSAMADADGGLPVELSQDGVHPTLAGYAIMKNLAAAAMRQARKR